MLKALDLDKMAELLAPGDHRIDLRAQAKKLAKRLKLIEAFASPATSRNG
jgi:hypothetical protein